MILLSRGKMKHRIETIAITSKFVNEKLLPTIWNIWYASSIGKRTISRDPYGLVGWSRINVSYPHAYNE